MKAPVFYASAIPVQTSRLRGPGFYNSGVPLQRSRLKGPEFYASPIPVPLSGLRTPAYFASGSPTMTSLSSPVSVPTLLYPNNQMTCSRTFGVSTKVAHSTTNQSLQVAHSSTTDPSTIVPLCVTNDPSTQVTPPVTNDRSSQVTPSATTDPFTQVAPSVTNDTSPETVTTTTADPSTQVTPSLTTDQSTQVTPPVTNDQSTQVTHPVTNDQSTQVTPSVITDQCTQVTPSVTTDQSTQVTPSVTTDQSTQVTHPLTNDPSTQVTPPMTNGPSTQVTSSVANHPSAQVTPSVTNDPSTQVIPSVTTDPSTQVTPSATNDPSTHVTPFATNDPSTQVIPPVITDESTRMTPSVSNDPSKQAAPPVTNGPSTKVTPSVTTDPQMTPSVIKYPSTQAADLTTEVVTSTIIDSTTGTTQVDMGVATDPSSLTIDQATQVTMEIDYTVTLSSQPSTESSLLRSQPMRTRISQWRSSPYSSRGVTKLHRRRKRQVAVTTLPVEESQGVVPTTHEFPVSVPMEQPLSSRLELPDATISQEVSKPLHVSLPIKDGVVLPMFKDDNVTVGVEFVQPSSTKTFSTAFPLEQGNPIKHVSHTLQLSEPLVSQQFMNTPGPQTSSVRSCKRKRVRFSLPEDTSPELNTFNDTHVNDNIVKRTKLVAENTRFDGQCEKSQNRKQEGKTWQDSPFELERIDTCGDAKRFQERDDSSSGGDEDSTETIFTEEDSTWFSDDESEISVESLQAMMKTINKADDLIAMLDSKPDREITTDISSVEKSVDSNKTGALTNSLSQELNINASAVDQISTAKLCELQVELISNSDAAIQSTSQEHGSRKRGNESLDTDGKVVFKKLSTKEDPVDGYKVKHICGPTSDGQTSTEPSLSTSNTSEWASSCQASSPAIDPQVEHSITCNELRGDEAPPSSGVGNTYEVSTTSLQWLRV